MSDNNFLPDENIRISNHRCAAIIKKDKKILLMYRKKAEKEFYTLVGGHMHRGEKAEDTLHREVFEESSLRIKNIKLAFELNDYLKDTYEYYFLCDWENGEARLGGEELQRSSSENVYKLVWIEKNQLNELNLLPQAIKEWILETDF